MPVEIAPGDGEYLKRVGSAPVGADAEQLAADVDTAGVFQRQDALDTSTAALVADSGSDTAQALSAQFVTFVDDATGEPITPSGRVIIRVDTATNQIEDIVFEEAEA